MDDTRRWVLLVVLVLLVVGLIAFARGADHHRGQQVGARALGHDVYPVSVAAALGRHHG
ncbi:MAG: hypothetical protein ACRDV2_17445 [Actinomycetes bacterium]